MSAEDALEMTADIRRLLKLSRQPLYHFHYTNRRAAPIKLRNDTLTAGRSKHMRYGIAWLLAVPISVLVIWWLLAHVL